MLNNNFNYCLLKIFNKLGLTIYFAYWPKCLVIGSRKLKFIFPKKT